MSVCYFISSNDRSLFGRKSKKKIHIAERYQPHEAKNNVLFIYGHL